MAMRQGDIIEIVYLTQKEGKLSQRYIRVIDDSGDYLKAYCYTRRQVRLFKKKNILAVRKVRSA
ncbi:hypothetical protein EWI07_01810 [Sporolactobacillus sp. THM7-4]|nr:hypothetical protein EWI07_01810 [Sporolactobacillus sp. THM7-4]